MSWNRCNVTTERLLCSFWCSSGRKFTNAHLNMNVILQHWALSDFLLVGNGCTKLIFIFLKLIPGHTFIYLFRAFWNHRRIKIIHTGSKVYAQHAQSLAKCLVGSFPSTGDAFRLLSTARVFFFPDLVEIRTRFKLNVSLRYLFHKQLCRVLGVQLAAGIKLCSKFLRLVLLFHYSIHLEQNSARA